MYSPAFALAGPLFETARSASRLTVVVTVVEVSLVLTWSLGDWADSEAVLSIEATVEPGLIWARIRTTFEEPALIAPSVLNEPPQLEPPTGLQGLAPSMQ